MPRSLRLRSPAMKLVTYTAILAGALGVGAAVGAAFGPEPSSSRDPQPSHDSGYLEPDTSSVVPAPPTSGETHASHGG